MPQLSTPTDDHAIKSMAFAVEFQRPLDGPAFRAAQSLAAELKDRLPGSTVKKSITFSFDERGVANSQSGEAVGGVAFSRVQPDGTPQLALTFEPNHVGVVCGVYDSWQNRLAEATALLKRGYAAIEDFTKPAGVALQYIDEFYWNDSIESFDFSSVIDTKSSYIPSNVFDLKGTWHCYQGFYRDAQLINVNIEAVSEQDRSVLRLNIFHKIPVVAASSAELFAPGGFTDLMKRMHEENKSILRDLLTSDIAKRIGLSPHV